MSDIPSPESRVPVPSPKSPVTNPSRHLPRTNFERAEGQLIKPDGSSIDIGLFKQRMPATGFAERSIKELAAQGSGERGLLRELVGAGRGAPFAPEDFQGLIATKQFTNGADAATVLCYLNPAYDGKQPGGCPTMYFRDTTAPLRDAKQHVLWVALEAGSGIARRA